MSVSFKIAEQFSANLKGASLLMQVNQVPWCGFKFFKMFNKLALVNMHMIGNISQLVGSLEYSSCIKLKIQLTSSSKFYKTIYVCLTVLREEDVEVDVLCFDYGTSEILSVNNVYPGLDANWTSIREQAVPCKIAGVKPASSVINIWRTVVNAIKMFIG